jgi:hypothetical protein
MRCSCCTAPGTHSRAASHFAGTSCAALSAHCLCPCLGRLWPAIEHNRGRDGGVFPIVINTGIGLESVDAELLELTRSLDAGTLRVFWRVRLPWALPYIFSSLKVAITLAVIGAIVAEFIGADKGLGYLILTGSGAMKTSVMFGVLLVLSAFGIVSFYAVSWAERLLCPWYIPLDSDPPAAERNESSVAPELC